MICKCQSRVDNASSDGCNRGRSFNRDLLHSFIRHELTTMSFALQLDPAFTIESGSRLFAEAQEAGVDFTVRA